MATTGDDEMSVSSARALVCIAGDDDATEVEISDGQVVPFGRENHGDLPHVRFGHDPTDRVVPRRVGAFIASNGRLIVDTYVQASRPQPVKIIRSSAPELLLDVGSAYSPPENRFEVHVQADDAVVRLLVDVRARLLERATGVSSRRVEIELSDTERAVYRALRAPMDRGGVDPATRGEAAATLGRGKDHVSEHVREMHRRLWTSQIPLHASNSKIETVVRTLIAHGVD